MKAGGTCHVWGTATTLTEKDSHAAWWLVTGQPVGLCYTGFSLHPGLFGCILRCGLGRNQQGLYTKECPSEWKQQQESQRQSSGLLLFTTPGPSLGPTPLLATSVEMPQRGRKQVAVRAERTRSVQKRAR